MPLASKGSSPIQKLRQLLGLPAWGAALAADMLTIQLGGRRAVERPLGGSATRGELAIHIQHPWRVAHAERTLLCQADYDPVDKASIRAAMEALAMVFRSEPIVTAVNADASGGIRLVLEGNLLIETVTGAGDHTENSESWRVFAPGDLRSHFAVMSDGSIEAR